MKVLSLFTGGGLGDFGLTLAGMEIVGQIEIDAYCQKILKLRWPEVPKWEDIRNVKGKEVLEKCGPVDLVSGGFPCPDFSVAGRSAGFKGVEGALFFDAIRVIEEVKPKYILLENVGGFSRFQEEGFKFIESAGYEWEYAYFNSLSWGVPQNRNRIFIFGIRRDCLPDSQQVPGLQREQAADFYRLCSDIKNTQRGWAYPGHSKSGWEIKSDETRRGGKTNGPANRMDRLRVCGNGQQVQVVEWIGKRIIAFDNAALPQKESSDVSSGS